MACSMVVWLLTVSPVSTFQHSGSAAEGTTSWHLGGLESRRGRGREEKGVGEPRGLRRGERDEEGSDWVPTSPSRKCKLE